MKKFFLIGFLLIVLAFILWGGIIRIGPSPKDPYDEKGCLYLGCKDICVTDLEYKAMTEPLSEPSQYQVITNGVVENRTNINFASPICYSRLGCGSNTDQYYCAAKNNKCIKQPKPMCIIIFGNYFCSNFKFYSRESCM